MLHMKHNTELSIIIVNFNTRDLLKACLDTVFSEKKATDRWEVIVVDNNSTDGSAEMVERFPHKVRLIRNFANAGFAAANNQGINEAHGAYILLLNSDTEIPHGALHAMIMFMEERDDIGAATCKLLLPNGTIDPACHRGFPTPWASITYFLGLEKVFPRVKVFSQYHQWYKNMTIPHEIACPSGAFFLVRRNVIDRVGLLDERFFMYAEDIDWAYRIRQSGFSIYFNPLVTVLHKKKQSGRAHSDSVKRRQTEEHFYRTMEQFYRKHYMNLYSPLITLFIILLLRVRIIILKIFSV